MAVFNIFTRKALNCNGSPRVNILLALWMPKGDYTHTNTGNSTRYYGTDWYVSTHGKHSTFTKASTSTTLHMLCNKACTTSTRPISAKATPYSTLMDETVTIEVSGLLPEQSVTLRSYFNDEGKQFESYAHYVSSDDGDINTTIQHSHGGLYTGIDPMGLFWSMVPSPNHRPGTRYMKGDVTKPMVVNISVHSGHLTLDQVHNDSPIDTTSVERWYMSNNVELIKVHTGRLRGSLLKPKGPGPFPAVVDMFGGVVAGSNTRAALLASRGYAALALLYFGGEGQPQSLAELDVLEMEYFEEAVDWLSSQSVVQRGGVGTIGVSLGGEMALAMAIFFPEKIRAMIGISTCAAFTTYPTSYKGETFPSGRITRDVTYSPSGAINVKSLIDSIDINHFQKFEKIRCPVLLLSGNHDECVPVTHSYYIADKINTNGKNNQCELIVYPGAGHLIEPPHAPVCTSSYQPPWGLFNWGGIPVHHAHAQTDAWKKLLTFLKDNMVDDQKTYPSKL